MCSRGEPHYPCQAETGCGAGQGRHFGDDGASDFPEDVIDGGGHLERTVVSVRPTARRISMPSPVRITGRLSATSDAINCHS